MASLWLAGTTPNKASGRRTTRSPGLGGRGAPTLNRHQTIERHASRERFEIEPCPWGTSAFLFSPGYAILNSVSIPPIAMPKTIIMTPAIRRI